jgi:hypothetical protein
MDDHLLPIHSGLEEEGISGLAHKVLMASVNLHKYFVYLVYHIFIRYDGSF